MICRNCGHENKDNSTFCAVCGSRLSEQQPVQYAPVFEAAPPQGALPVKNKADRKWPKYVWITAIIYAVAMNVVNIISLINTYNRLFPNTEKGFLEIYSSAVFGNVVSGLIVVLLYIIHTRKIAVITAIIPMIISVLGIVMQIIFYNGNTVKQPKMFMANIIISALMLLIIITYFIVCIKKSKPWLYIGIMLLLRAATAGLDYVREYTDLFHDEKFTYVHQDKTLFIAGIAVGVVHTLILVLATVSLCRKQKEQQAMTEQQFVQPSENYYG